MKDQRPDPESLLKRVEKEELQMLRGKLKIYFGAAPGVGKTYTMLEDALVKHHEGIDIIIGIVESHGRTEIERLIKDFEILPRLAFDYHGQRLNEFDLDLALKRKPAIILVDEMAHTNAPGARHEKRWQDIKELLDRGIDVYTTLNVQHVESLKDVVSQIAHISIKETVPDSMLELADAIELIDLPPEDLLKRLQEGKIYIPRQAEIASENFFRKGNLFALRELALRLTAEHVSADVLSYRQGQQIQHIWPTKEKILVCVGASPRSTKVIRTARRMAVRLKAHWIALHINTPLTEEPNEGAIQNLRLAEQLGGETKMISGLKTAEEILHFAREQNITRIILGKRFYSPWRQLFFRNLTEQVLNHSGEIDIYLISDEKTVSVLPKKRAILKTSKINYMIAIVAIFLITLLNYWLSPYLPTSSLLMIYFLAIIYVALKGKTGPALLASVFSVLAFNFLFLHPQMNFSIKNMDDLLTLLVMLIVSQVISRFVIISKRQAMAAKLAERNTSYLHTLSQQLASTRGVDKLLNVAVQYIAKMVDAQIMAFISGREGLNLRAIFGNQQSIRDKEKNAVQWAYDMGQTAGLGTDTLSFSEAVYIPMIASQSPIGVLRVFPNPPQQLYSPEQIHLLEACANQVALAIEVDRLHEQATQSDLKKENKLSGALLQSVSHNLHAPLAAMLGELSTLMELGNKLDKHTIKELVEKITMELNELSRLINNLLQMSYLESDTIKLEKKYHSLSQLISVLMISHQDKFGRENIHISIPKDLPKIPMDVTLIQEVLNNLIDNAIKLTSPDTPIEIYAVKTHDKVIVSVEDHGPGIVPDEVNQLFEKFYRGRLLTTQRGLGLGLAICRSIIQAHGGEIWAENSKTHGAVFHFSLPI